MGLRRFVVIGGAVALTIAGAHEMYLVFAVNGITALAIFMLALFLALFAWIALSFTSGLAGFCSLLAGGGRRLGTGPDTPLPHLAARTALLMPTYNEQPARVMAGLQAMWESLRETGAVDAFDLFILSDTTDPHTGSPRRQASWRFANGPALTRPSSIAGVRGTSHASQATSRSG